MANWLTKLFSNDKTGDNYTSVENEKKNEPYIKQITVDTSFITNPNKENEKDKLVYSLTDRERDVFLCLLKGHTIKATAEELGISYSTVNTHMNSVYRKLNVNSKSQLIINYNEYAL